MKMVWSVGFIWLYYVKIPLEQLEEMDNKYGTLRELVELR